MAAVLACGEGAVLSHLSAAALWRLRENDPAVIDVSLASRSGRRWREGIRVHRPVAPRQRRPNRSPRYPRDHRPPHAHRPRRGPRHPLARTHSRRGRVPEAAGPRRADERDRTQPHPHRRRAANRHPGPPRARHHPDPQPARGGLPAADPRAPASRSPRSTRRLGPFTIDFLWRNERLAVETDGRRSHERDRQRERDSTRDAWLAAHGYRPLRFTWAQVTQRPEEVLAALEAARAES